MSTKFEWNEEKREINLRRHGIDFEHAKEIWQGETTGGGSFPPEKRGAMSEKITKKALGDVAESRTDWARVDAFTEDELERAIAQDSDADVVEPDWTQARLIMPQAKDSIHLRIDPDVLGWYKKQGRGYQTRMQAVLRAFYEAHRNDAA